MSNWNKERHAAARKSLYYRHETYKYLPDALAEIERLQGEVETLKSADTVVKYMEMEGRLDEQKELFWKQLNFQKARADSYQKERDALIRECEVLREGLGSIEEYWNGGSESAVDAAEECRDRAADTLAKAKRVREGNQ